MKNRFQKHFAHCALVMIGLGLGTLSHATDAPVAKTTGNAAQSVSLDPGSTTPSWATEQYARWRWNPGRLIYPAASVTVNGATVYDQPNVSYQAVTTVRDQLYANLQSSLDTGIRAELSKLRDFKWSTVTIAGPIDLSIKPNKPGQGSTFSVGSLSAWIAFNFSGNLDDWFGTSWECNGSVNTGPLTVGGNVDLITGTTSNTALSLNNPTVSLSCSSGYGIIPGVSFFTDYFIGRAVGNINNSLQQMKVPLQLDSFMGLNTALPYHTLWVNSSPICPQGCYMSDQIRGSLTTLVQSADVAIHFNPKVGRFLAPPGNISPIGPDEETGVTYIKNDEAVSISLSGGAVKLTVYDTTLFTSWFGCTGPGTCIFDY
jgi:hypothetical protein